MVLLDPANKTVLIIEDDEQVRDAIAEALQDEGYTVRIAANGREALDALRTGQSEPRLILLDLAMPVMDGWEFLRERERQPRLAGIPVCAVTAAEDLPTDVEHGIRKPFRLEDLLEVVARYVP
ncbi:MAG: response regulator [Anaeromyxobacteraceae bacterium]